MSHSCAPHKSRSPCRCLAKDRHGTSQLPPHLPLPTLAIDNRHRLVIAFAFAIIPFGTRSPLTTDDRVLDTQITIGIGIVIVIVIAVVFVVVVGLDVNFAEAIAVAVFVFVVVIDPKW